MEKTLAQRLVQRRQELGLSQTDVASRMDITPQSVQQWEAGKTTPRGKRMTMLSSILQCSPEWLQFGIGAPGSSLASKQENHSQLAVNTSSEWTEPVKIAKQHLSAGHGAYEEGMSEADEYEGVEDVDISRLHGLGIQTGCARIIKIKGDSMYPTLWDGDMAIADTYIPHLISGKIYAFYFDGELKVKRFTKRMDGNWIISSDNKDNPSLMDEIVSPRDTQHLHMIGQVKDLYSRKL